MRNNKKILYFFFLVIQIKKKNTFEVKDIFSENRKKAENNKEIDFSEKEIIFQNSKKIENPNKIFLQKIEINKNDINNLKFSFARNLDMKLQERLKTLKKFKIKKNEILDFIKFLKLGIKIQNSEFEKNDKRISEEKKTKNLEEKNIFEKGMKKIELEEEKFEHKKKLFEQCKFFISRILNKYKSSKNFALKNILKKLLLNLFRNRFSYCFE